jgi:hypothetical protein
VETHHELGKHADAFGHVDEGQLLRGGHNDGSGEGDRLAQRQLDVSRAGREVDDEVIQLAPLAGGQQLLDEACGRKTDAARSQQA